MDIAFVILNYNTFEETADCIRSIEEKTDTQDYRIIVVDNGSKADCIDKIKELVKNKDFIELIFTNENLGFARGNNVGIRYANKKYSPRFTVVLNSDTELIQGDLFYKLNKEYESSQFALLGPLIINADGRCDNSPRDMPTKEAVSRELKTFRKEKIYIQTGWYRIYCGIRFFRNQFIQKILRKPVSLCSIREFHRYRQQVVLAGCFLVFSQKAFEFVEGFDESTFLYYEEPILYLHLTQHGLITVYNPVICIYHKGGCTANKGHATRKKKLLFINKCYQDSAQILLSVLGRYECG